jgi:aminomethyltransferase
MVPFAGYNIPIQNKRVNAEHETVRNGVGVFDVSHMGEFMLKGENALALNYATIEEFSNQINYKNVA